MLIRVSDEAARRRRLRASKLVHRGEEFVVLSFDAVGGASPLTARLTAVEREIVQMVLAGRSNREIARARGRATSTIQNQLSSIYRKLGISSRADLAASIVGSR